MLIIVLVVFGVILLVLLVLVYVHWKAIMAKKERLLLFGNHCTMLMVCYQIVTSLATAHTFKGSGKPYPQPFRKYSTTHLPYYNHNREPTASRLRHVDTTRHRIILTSYSS